jgi:preprotein translocase subunit SecA
MGFFSQNNRNIKKLKKIADKVVSFEEEFSKLSDSELKQKTNEFLSKLEQGSTLNDILPEAFATVREAAWRVLGMKHFYVQILGGIALHQGRIAEMATGEGKTLVATLPSYLNALAKKGVHVVTVNEYLAKRDADWMGKVHRFLGLSVGVIISGTSPEEKREAYACDITYGTNNEFGFDYLRDNMVIKAKQRTQRSHYFAIVDEVDSILIDEARTPLIISGAGMKSSKSYYDAQNFAKKLTEEEYEIDVKLKTINLTEAGIEKAERFYKIENLSDADHIELNHYINNALRANFIMKLDENYIVKDDEIIIVDEFTGRLMAGRRYSDGLHQAIEAKENVEIKDENKTLATVTFQNYFRLYRKLSGMTGTAKTEEAEFNGIYNLDVVTIPTNRPNKRFDEPDIIYRSIAGKLRAVVNEVKEKYESGQPVLIGTITIDQSEQLSNALKKAKVPHNVLNAKNHEKESEIVAQAGRYKSITIATNMAGRGTDILLGGNPEFLAKNKLKEKGYTDAQISFVTDLENQDISEEMENIKKLYDQSYKEFKQITDEEKEKVIALGGLAILGTERHESRRIDNQLRGRAARQGDPGQSVFFLSLEDDLLIRFGGERMQKITDFFRIGEDTPFQLPLLSKQIEGAQKRVEIQNYASRRSVLEFDNVMNKQREIIYGERNKVLDGEDVHNQIMAMFPDVVSPLIYAHINPDKPYYEWDLEPVNKAFENNLLPKGTNLLTPEFVDDCEVEEVLEKVLNTIYALYEEKIAITKELKTDFSEFERYILLRVVDSLWMDHIDQMTILRTEISAMSYGNQDPIVAYKREGFDMFEEMTEKIKTQTCTLLLNARIEVERKAPQKRPEYKPIEVREGSGEAKNEKLTGRNEPCPCGSGKKYKHCHGKE